LILPTVGVLIIIVPLILRLHVQILREEALLKTHYGDEYVEYCKHAPRYLGF
jgi:protein-S-isoprenylcysteine O-methyltransferase Ste14